MLMCVPSVRYGLHGNQQGVSFQSGTDPRHLLADGSNIHLYPFYGRAVVSHEYITLIAIDFQQGFSKEQQNQEAVGRPG